MSARRLRLLTGGVTLTPMPTELATERLILTREELADTVWLADLFTARGAGTATEAEARSRVASMHEPASAHGIGVYVLRPRYGGAPAGHAAVIVGRGTVEEPEIAYELVPDAQGHGYATEGAHEVFAVTAARPR
jgi:RimJ/RimL family protein N-acetyltransferase